MYVETIGLTNDIPVSSVMILSGVGGYTIVGRLDVIAAGSKFFKTTDSAEK